jgi:hypothetical protein
MLDSNKTHTYPHFIAHFIILAVIAGIFYFDKGLMIGTDNSHFLDLSFFISQKGKFLIDFFDYRIPVLPFIVSPIFRVGLTDFANLYIVLVLVFFLYIFTIYFISLSITRSKCKALLVSIITFVSISSRQFDAARNICWPLFHHTLELMSVVILISIIVGLTLYRKRTLISLAFLSGLLFGLTFIGRQTQIFPPILLFFYSGYMIYKERLKVLKNYALMELVTCFCAGSIVAIAVILLLFYVPHADYFYLLKNWLLDFPALLYGNSKSILGIVKNLVKTVLIGLPNWRAINLPLIWITYVFAIVYFTKILVTENENIKERICYFYVEHRRAILLIMLVAAMCVFTSLATGFAPKRYQSPFFTLYAALLAFFLLFTKHKKNAYVTIIVFLFMFPMLLPFVQRERLSYKISLKQMNTQKFPSEVAAALNNVMDKKGDIVLVLGGQSIVARLVGYKPFMGCWADGFLYVLPKLYGSDFTDRIYDNLKNVNVAYTLPDYPNLACLGEDISNVIYQKIESMLAKDFEIVVEIPPDNSYPYNYKKGAIIYKRKT